MEGAMHLLNLQQFNLISMYTLNQNYECAKEFEVPILLCGILDAHFVSKQHAEHDAAQSGLLLWTPEPEII